MAGRLGCHSGGIVSLLEVLDDHGEAIEYDLVVAGWTLDDVPHRLNWRALLRFVSQSAQHRGTALFRTLIGDDHVWGLTEQLLATVVDILQVGNWQFAAANSKKKPKKPKPIRRPGVGQARTIERGTAVPLSEARKMFEAHNPAVFATTVWQPPTVSERRCTVGGCDGKHHAKGLCNRHYQQQRRRSA